MRDRVNVVNDTTTANLLALIPRHRACVKAFRLTWVALPTSILHSFRVYLYAQAFLDNDNDRFPMGLRIGVWQGGERDPRPAAHVVFVASILHAIGVSKVFDDVPERFEVVSARVTADVMRIWGGTASEARDAWVAVALHTTSGVAENMGGLVRALRLAVRLDLG